MPAAINKMLWISALKSSGCYHGNKSPRRLNFWLVQRVDVAKQLDIYALYGKTWRELGCRAFTWFAAQKLRVMGNGRICGFMLACWVGLPRAPLEKVSSRILNKVCGVKRVTHDVSSKPSRRSVGIALMRSEAGPKRVRIEDSATWPDLTSAGKFTARHQSCST
jgi:GMP synthase C terminal domain